MIAESSFAVFRGQIDRKVFAPGFDLWRRVEAPLRRLFRAAANLPDRGGDAGREDLPPEFFRFPYP
jgi:hypothetical protein